MVFGLGVRGLCGVWVLGWDLEGVVLGGWMGVMDVWCAGI